jgi:quercetin dioxygenase-like cupin family protein
MAQPESAADQFDAFTAERLVRYADLKPCTTAFIDTRTPGSAEKENFTIIGPGVAESPDQHIHISIPHGFNIGGARQPPGCLNSQHSHETAEVFVVHSGTWAFLLGPDKEDGEVILGPGDTISIPTQVFRGFKNVGEDTGFLFAVLGGDDPGHVTWAPYVFENAKSFGLVLLEDGSLVDATRGETIPEGKKPMPPTTDEDVAKQRRLRADEMGDCVVKYTELGDGADAAGSIPILKEVPIIGKANGGEQIGAGRMNWPHGFNLRYITVDPGVASKQHKRHEEEVIFVHKGRLTVTFPEGDLELVPGDTLTIPIDMPRAFGNDGSDVAEAYIVRGGDDPQPATVTQ